MSMLYYSLKNEVGVDSKEEQAELDNDPDEEDTDDVNIGDERERHWRNVFNTYPT